LHGILFQELLCDARIGDQRGYKAGVKYDADSVRFVHAAGHGDNFGDAAKLFAGDADHALAEWWCEDFSATTKQDGAGVGADTGVEKLTTFLRSDAVIPLRLRRVPAIPSKAHANCASARRVGPSLRI
jgi:hypothetical protein